MTNTVNPTEYHVTVNGNRYNHWPVTASYAMSLAAQVRENDPSAHVLVVHVDSIGRAGIVEFWGPRNG